MSRTSATVLGVAAVVALALVALFALCVPSSLGHRFYVVSGKAAISPEAATHARLPAVICTGHGGPLESSGIYGSLLASPTEGHALVFCLPSENVQEVDYRESVYYGSLPRNLHVYVWLEHSEDLVETCKTATSPITSVRFSQLPSYNSANPSASPCFMPAPKGALGYTVAFRTEVDGDHETAQVEVRPSGYP